MFAVASHTNFDARTFTGYLRVPAHPENSRLTPRDSSLPTGKTLVFFRIQHAATPLLGV
jgi:hypothetical protein